MNTLKRARDDEDMGLNEALDYAADKRKFLILKVVKSAFVIWSQYRDDDGLMTLLESINRGALRSMCISVIKV